MPFFIKNLLITDDVFKHRMIAADIESLSANIDFTFLKEGYHLVVGQKGYGEYEKGNRISRKMLGAIAKYFKFTVKINETTDQFFELIVENTSSEIMKGTIGLGQIKTEIHRLAKVFEAL